MTRAGTPSAGAGTDATLAPEQRAVKNDDAAATAAAPAPDEIEAEPERLHLHMPVDVRNLALAVIAVLLSLYALQWAKAVVVPLLLGVMFSYALSPAIDRIERWRVPRAASAGLLLTAILAGLGTIGWAVSDDADALIETLPEVAQKLRKALQKPGQIDQPSTLEKVQQAATEIERATEETALPTTASAWPRPARPRWPPARVRAGLARGVGDGEPGRADVDERAADAARRHPGRGRKAAHQRQGLPLDRHARPGHPRRPGDAGRLHHLLPARLGHHLPAQDGQARRPAPEPEEDHGAGARRSPRADAALPVRADGDQRRRRRPLRPGLLRPRPRPLAGLGHPRRHHQPRSLSRRGGDRRRLDRDGHRPVRSRSTAGSTSAPPRSRSTPSSATC